MSQTDYLVAASNECSCMYRLQQSEIRPWSGTPHMRRSSLIGRQWPHHVHTMCPCFPVPTWHRVFLHVPNYANQFRSRQTATTFVHYWSTVVIQTVACSEVIYVRPTFNTTQHKNNRARKLQHKLARPNETKAWFSSLLCPRN